MGEHAITALLDAWKCFELILRDALFQEARLVGYDLRLLWMLCQCYSLPRRLQAFGSVSFAVNVFQGILAGCSHACGLMSVLLLRLLDKIRRPGVVPRALIDDISLQWTGVHLSQMCTLWTAVSEFKAGSALLGL
eukprot:3458169-Pyramimonas_sp.AAC.1